MRRLGAPDAAARRSYYARIAGLTGKRKGETEETLRNEYNGVMTPFTAELLGTMLMILMGDGVVANVVLDKTKGYAGGWMVVTTAWALAVFVGVVVAAPYSGAHLAQMIGAALGAVLVWLAYRPHFEATPDPRTKLAVFCTAPEIRRTGWNFLTELIGTFSLLFIIFYITVGEITLSDNISTLPVGLGSVGALPVAFTVWVIGLSLGGPTGYAINPARDLAPRVVHALLPIRGKGGSDWSYAWIPVAAPLCGAALAAWLYNMLL